jgi:hypothetical protein
MLALVTSVRIGLDRWTATPAGCRRCGHSRSIRSTTSRAPTPSLTAFARWTGTPLPRRHGHSQHARQRDTPTTRFHHDPPTAGLGPVKRAIDRTIVGRRETGAVTDPDRPRVGCAEVRVSAAAERSAEHLEPLAQLLYGTCTDAWKNPEVLSTMPTELMVSVMVIIVGAGTHRVVVPVGATGILRRIGLVARITR